MLDELAAIAAGTRPPVEPRDAASVILLREAGGIGSAEALLMIRQRSMNFAPGMVAFPGGSVDPSDSLAPVELTDSGADEWATALGVDAGTVRLILSAAIRETFEETGVLLATKAGEGVDATTPEWRKRRHSLENHDLVWSALIDETGITLTPETLHPWSCWVTPVGETRRYRTWFFLASVPGDTRVEIESTEAFRSAWIAPDDALAAFERGEIQMLPPQQSILRDLAAELRNTSLAELQSAPRTPERVEPVVRFDSEGPYLDIPGGR